MTDDEIILEATERVKSVNRLDEKFHMNILDPVDDQVIKWAILDARDDINSYIPQTFYSLDFMWNGPDSRWKRLLLLGASKNVYYTLVSDWTQRGFEVDIAGGELRQADRTDSIKSLWADLDNQFERYLERLKTTSQKFSKGSSTYHTNNPLSLNTFNTVVRATRIRL